jgi:hypothetical protein
LIIELGNGLSSKSFAFEVVLDFFHTALLFQDVWHCEICNRKPGRGFGKLHSLVSCSLIASCFILIMHCF